MMRRTIMAVLVLTGSAPLVAEAAPAEKRDPLICQQQQQTGTRTARAPKICHTASEWKQLSLDQRDAQGRSTKPFVDTNPNPKGY